MRKLILFFMACMLCLGVTDAEAAHRKRKHVPKKPEHHKKHHIRHHKKHVITIQQQQIQILVVSTPQCGFLIFRSDCNKDASNNITVARKFDGMTARNNRQELRQFMGVDPIRIAWCAAFVNSVLKQNGYSTSESLMAASYINYGIMTHAPLPGDVVVYRPLGRGQVTGHVGFFLEIIEEAGEKYVLTLGGNQDHGVTISAYPLRKVVAFRRPVAEQNI